MNNFVGLLAFMVSVGAWATNYESETQEIKNKLQHLEIHSSLKYCITSTLTCRELVMFKDKSTGLITDEVMYQNFLSSERSVATTGWYLKNVDGTYRARMDNNFDGKINIDFIEPANQNLMVTKSTTGTTTIHDITLKKLGTTRKVVSTISFGNELCILNGIETDDSDSAIKIPVRIEYARIQ